MCVFLSVWECGGVTEVANYEMTRLSCLATFSECLRVFYQAEIRLFQESTGGKYLFWVLNLHNIKIRKRKMK